jgi:LAO/AO transport system kinase
VRELHAARLGDGIFAERRREQELTWTWELVHSNLLVEFRRHPAVRAALAQTLAAVAESRLTPASAARTLLDLFGS